MPEPGPDRKNIMMGPDRKFLNIFLQRPDRSGSVFRVFEPKRPALVYNRPLFFSVFLFQIVVETNNVEMRTDRELHTEGEGMQKAKDEGGCIQSRVYRIFLYFKSLWVFN